MRVLKDSHYTFLADYVFQNKTEISIILNSPTPMMNLRNAQVSSTVHDTQYLARGYCTVISGEMRITTACLPQDFPDSEIIEICKLCMHAA